MRGAVCAPEKVMVPVRTSPSLTSTVTPTVPSPVPEVLSRRIQAEEADAVQLPAVVTEMNAVEPSFASKDKEVRFTVKVSAVSTVGSQE